MCEVARCAEKNVCATQGIAVACNRNLCLKKSQLGSFLTADVVARIIQCL